MSKTSGVLAPTVQVKGREQAKERDKEEKTLTGESENVRSCVSVFLSLCLHAYMSYSKRDIEQGIISQSYDSWTLYHMRQD